MGKLILYQHLLHNMDWWCLVWYSGYFISNSLWIRYIGVKEIKGVSNRVIYGVSVTGLVFWKYTDLVFSADQTLMKECDIFISLSGWFVSFCSYQMTYVQNYDFWGEGITPFTFWADTNWIILRRERKSFVGEDLSYHEFVRESIPPRPYRRRETSEAALARWNLRYMAWTSFSQWCYMWFVVQHDLFRGYRLWRYEEPNWLFWKTTFLCRGVPHHKDSSPYDDGRDSERPWWAVWNADLVIGSDVKFTEDYNAYDNQSTTNYISTNTPRAPSANL